MRYLKKILFYLMIILTFTISFSNEENRITIYERENEPAKLKIGVTKMITKELAMDFDPEKKIIYCEVPEEVTENDSIYVSETLDEMPSTSTTNGRKTINNINKYLTKDVKANANFNYKVVDVNDEATGEVKKYLVINCKNPVSSVYLYIVENGTYKMKGLYRGVFATLYEAQESDEAPINYGTIRFKNTNDLVARDIITSTNGANIVIDRGGKLIEQSQDKKNDQGVIIESGVVDSLTDKGFPKKFTREGKNVKYRVKVTLGTGSVARQDIDFNLIWKDFDGIFDITLPVNVVGENLRTIRENIRIYTEKNSDYIKIQLKDWDNEFSILNLPVKIDFYRTGNITDNEDEEFTKHMKTISFNLKIDSKEKIEMVNNESSIEILPTEDLHNGGGTLVYDGKKVQLEKNGQVIKESEKYIKLSKGYLEKTNFNERVNLQIIQNGKIIQEGIIVEPTGEFTSKGIELKGVTYNSRIGTLNISADNKDNYFKYAVSIDVPYRDKIVDEFQLRYYNSNRDLLKIDKLVLNISPVEEEELKETSGGLYVTYAGGLNYAEITQLGTTNSIHVIRDLDQARFEEKNAKLIGNFPKRLDVAGDKKHDWGEKQRVAIINESENTETKYIDLGVGGTFTTYFDDTDKTPILSKEEDHSDAVITKDNHIGIRATTTNPYLEIAIFDYRASAKTVLNKTIRIEYQAFIEGNWVVKKADKLRIIIQPGNTTGNSPKIEIHNPIVWYDYKSGVRHERKAELLGDTATTLESNGITPFIKNTNLDYNDQWIKVKNIPEYVWWTRHKIEINTGKGEVVKFTDDNGKTKSSTFIDIGNKNVVMVAYDGKDPADSTGQKDRSMSFGVAGYDFKGGSGNYIISQYDKNGNLAKVQEYSVEIDKFSGIHYVDSQYDIKPRKDYIKNYEFQQDLGVIEPITIDYGTVGFRDIDTRITEQSEGKGIEFRLTEKVILLGEGEYKGYNIPATLEFVSDTCPSSKIFSETDNGEKYWIFKGKSEESYSAKIALHIDNQEYLIPEARFKIVEAKDVTKSPLRVGVVVSKNKNDYFEEVADLYLNLTAPRFIKTELIFENKSIQMEASLNNSGQMYWIKLNEKEFSKGHIENYTGKSWGRVGEEVVDIPNNLDGELVIQVIDGDYNVDSMLCENLNGTTCDISIGETIKNILQIGYDKGTNYLKFRLVNSENDIPYHDGVSGKFYLRFSLKKEDKIEYLFTQQYTVKFLEGPGLTGDTKVTIKNPMMTVERDKYSIYVDRKNNIQGTVKEAGNHNTRQDSEQWWKVEAPINYPNIANHDFKLYSDEKCTIPFNNNKVPGINLEFITDKIGNITNNFSTLKVGVEELNLDVNSKEKTTEIYVKWKEKPETSWERKDRIVIETKKFDPRYYGKVFPSGKDNTASNNYKEECEVGEGYENLTKGISKSYYYIDLNTTYRDYQRYMGGLKEIGRDGFVVRGRGDEIIAIDEKNSKQVKGSIVFKKEIDSELEDTSEYISEVAVKPNLNNTNNLPDPEKYRIYFKVTNEEYKKLDYNTKYNLFFTGDKNTLEIGYKNRTDSAKCKDLILNKPLNFMTSKPPFIINTYTLDFGTINIYFNNGKPIKKSAETLVTVEGENIENVDLTLENGNKVEDGKVVTFIVRYDNTGIIENDKLKVENIVLEKKVEDKKKHEEKIETMKTYNLSGELTVPLDSKTGNYIGVIYINSTIIAK